MPLPTINGTLDPSAIGASHLLAEMPAYVPVVERPKLLGLFSRPPVPGAAEPMLDMFQKMEAMFPVSADGTSLHLMHEAAGTEAAFKMALDAKTAGVTVDTSKLTKEAETQLSRLNGISQQIDKASTAIFPAAGEFLKKHHNYGQEVFSDLGKLRQMSAAGAPLAGANIAAQAAAFNGTAGFKHLTTASAPGHLIADAASGNITFKVFEGTAAVDKVIGKIDGAGKIVLDAAELGNAERAFGQWHSAVQTNTQKYVTQATENFGAMRTKIGGMKDQLNKVRTEVLGMSAVDAAVPKVADALAADASKVVNAVKNAEGAIISKTAQEAGVVGHAAMTGKGLAEGEQALGWFGRLKANMKANLNISELGKDAKTGEVVVSKATGTLGKGVKIASTAAGAVLMGYGLKDLGQVVGVVGPDTDEQGKEVPADTGKLIKSIAEIGAGGALAYFTLLKGGKAAGMVHS